MKIIFSSRIHNSNHFISKDLVSKSGYLLESKKRKKGRMEIMKDMVRCTYKVFRFRHSAVRLISTILLRLDFSAMHWETMYYYSPHILQINPLILKLSKCRASICALFSNKCSRKSWKSHSSKSLTEIQKL